MESENSVFIIYSMIENKKFARFRYSMRTDRFKEQKELIER
jgi:hypothetical protein